MNRDDVLSAIKEAMLTGIYTQWTSPTEKESMTVPVTWEQVERFAAIIEQRARESEREACARICYEARNQDVSPLVLYSRIRARADK